MRFLLIIALAQLSMSAMADKPQNNGALLVAQNRSLMEQAMENMSESSKQPTVYQRIQERQQQRELHQQQIENMRLQNELLKQQLEMMRQQQ